MGFVTHFETVLVLLFFLIWIGVIAFLYFKKRKSVVYLLFFTIFYVYLFKVLDYTLFQFQSLLFLKHFAPNLMLKGQPGDKAINLIPLLTLTSLDLKTVFLNVLLFVPFGFGLPFVTNFRLKKVVITGMLVSISIELLQLVTGLMAKMTFRVADINDVLFNTAGAAVGYVLFVGFIQTVRRVSRNWKIANHPILHYINQRPQIGATKMSKKPFIIILIATVILIGFMVHQKGQVPMNNNKGQEGIVSQNGDLCGGTGGNGQVVSIGNNSFSMKRNDGSNQTVMLSNQAIIKTSAGTGSITDLKIGNRVTLVGGPNPNGSFTADDVFVCTPAQTKK